MDDFDRLEENAGHVLTMLETLHLGTTTYYCERCGAFVRIGRVLEIFHVAPGSPSKTSKCVELPIPPGNGRPRTLKDKLGDDTWPSQKAR